jgi:hypothetical protein
MVSGLGGLMIQLIGDELWYRGYMVAMLAQSGVPASTTDDFLSDLSNGKLFDDVLPYCAECKAEALFPHLHDCSAYKKHWHVDADKETLYDCALDDVIRSMKAFSKGGLIKLTDLESILVQLKEEKDINE